MFSREYIFHIKTFMKQQIVALTLFIFSTLVSASPLKYIVAADGSGEYTSINTAINACPDHERCVLFVKNGRYTEQLSLGSKTSPSKKLISLIGESDGGVVITHHESRKGSGKPTFEDICTVKLYANDFYAENITIENTATSGMAEALYVAGDRLTFKSCRIVGYQDAFRSKKGVRAYFKDCLLQGAVDFIYGGGTVFFDDCTINCVRGGGYIVAPEDRSKFIPRDSTASGKELNLEFIFRNCMITADPDVACESYYLGRPWNVNSGSYFLNCKLGSHIKKAGWQTMSGNESSASFAEYHSMDKNGRKSDVEERAAWSFQLMENDVRKFLHPRFVFAYLNPTTYDPVTLCTSPAKPQLTLSQKTLCWNRNPEATGYLLYRDKKFVCATSDTTYRINDEGNSTYLLKAINSNGVLSEWGTTAKVAMHKSHNTKIR